MDSNNCQIIFDIASYRISSTLSFLKLFVILSESEKILSVIVHGFQIEAFIIKKYRKVRVLNSLNRHLES